MSPEDPYEQLAERFIEHYDSLRGMVRHELLSAQIDRHLSAGVASVVDVGGGAGHQAFRLARAGYQVAVVEPSQRMLEEATTRLNSQEPSVQARVRLVHADAHTAPCALEGERFDVVCCHAVLPYVDDAAGVIDALAELAGPGALLSVLFKNADALAMRPALQQRWEEALRGFDAREDVGGLGVATSAHRLAEVSAWLDAAGFQTKAWYGIRVFSDHLQEVPIDQRRAVLSVEAEAAKRDPYRGLGRLIHVVAHPEPP